jgi:cellulose synthase/poly-beta-1,6-N-acetylglucosamine synthase-like glycosyltransferase
MMELVYWVSVLLVLYPNFIYPGVLFLLRSSAPKGRNPGALGPVALVCSVFNEEKVIARKIENFYLLDYPEVELYLGLDGCSDSTLTEIRRAIRDNRVKVFEFPRGGKVCVINALMEQVRQPYVVMTDANSMFRPDAVSNLLASLGKGVGVVCGRLVLLDEDGASGEGIYWRLETFIKKRESLFGSVIGANGAIYLFRRELFEPLPTTTINDDFSISMRIVEQGYAAVYAEDAVAEELQITTDAEEFRRHVRDAAGHFRALLYLRGLLNPLHGKSFFFYLSHRVLRWLGPFFLLSAFMSNALLLADRQYQALFATQCLGYGIMVVTYWFRIRWKPLYILSYFILLNLAIMVGFFKNLLSLQQTTWDSTRR